MGVKNEMTILKSQSKNSNCKVTPKWEQTNKVILLTTQNGGAEITDELPGGGTVKQKIAAQEQKIRNNKFQSSNRIPDSNTTTSSSSEISISSQQSSDENLDVDQKQKKSRIPIRSSSNVSLSSNLSSGSSSVFSNSNSRIPTPILTRKNLNFFNNNLEVKIKKQTAQIIKIYEINKAKRWVLISPDHRFVNQYHPKTTPALTYREHDKIRVEDLSETQIKILEKMQIEDNTEKNGNEIRFLGKK